jgi:hypothetical protein
VESFKNKQLAFSFSTFLDLPESTINTLFLACFIVFVIAGPQLLWVCCGSGGSSFLTDEEDIAKKVLLKATNNLKKRKLSETAKANSPQPRPHPLSPSTQKKAD